MQDLYAAVEKFRVFINTNIANPTNPQYVSVKQQLIRAITAVKPPIVNNDVKLYKIYDTLYGSFAEIRLPKSERTEFHSHMYSFFNGVARISDPKRYFLHYPTKVYENFITGITRFQEDGTITEKPSYHRRNSCRSKEKDYIEKFQHTTTDNKLVKESKLEALKTCIIERKIYNEIYKVLLHFQDANHLLEIGNLERLYMDYTHQSIDVTVDFVDTIIPFRVRVTTYKNRVMIACTLYVKQKHGTVKVQHYENNSKIETSSPPQKQRSVEQSFTTPQTRNAKREHNSA